MALNDFRNDIASAITEATGWQVLVGFSASSVASMPFFVVDIERVEYLQTFGGKIKVAAAVIAYAQWSDDGQRYIDQAFSWDTDHSIPSALVGTPGLIVTSAGDFATETINEKPVALSGRLFFEVII